MDALKIDLILNNIFRFIPINQNKDLCLVDKQWYNHINIWFTYEFLWHRNQQFIEKHQTFDDLIELMEPTFAGLVDLESPSVEMVIAYFYALNQSVPNHSLCI